MALVRKILEKTLTAGSTSISFTDSDIPNSLLRVYSSQASLFPISQTLSGNVLTVNYKAQTSNVGIALEIVKQGLDIVDNVTSTDTDKALSANQGKVLKDAIDTTAGNLSDLATVVNNLDIPDKITDLDDVSVSSIANGQVLAWNSTTEKFENVNQSGGGGGDSNLWPLDATPIKIGKAGSYDVYRQYFTGTSSGTSVTLDATGWEITKFYISATGRIKGSDGNSTCVPGYCRNNWGNGCFVSGQSLVLYLQPNASGGYKVWVDYYVVPT